MTDIGIFTPLVQFTPNSNVINRTMFDVHIILLLNTLVYNLNRKKKNSEDVDYPADVAVMSVSFVISIEEKFTAKSLSCLNSQRGM